MSVLCPLTPVVPLTMNEPSSGLLRRGIFLLKGRRIAGTCVLLMVAHQVIRYLFDSLTGFRPGLALPGLISKPLLQIALQTSWLNDSRLPHRSTPTHLPQRLDLERPLQSPVYLYEDRSQDVGRILLETLVLDRGGRGKGVSGGAETLEDQ
jgi:hypothetical protein